MIDTESQIDRKSAMWAYKMGCGAKPGTKSPFDEKTLHDLYWRMGREGKPWRLW